MSNDETKVCPYCGETIQQDAVKCKYCGTFLRSQSISYTVPELIEYARRIGIILGCLGILVFVIWLLCFDYPAYKHADTLEQFTYFVSCTIHLLLAILCAHIVQVLKK